jgi:hypothetical protein
VSRYIFVLSVRQSHKALLHEKAVAAQPQQKMHLDTTHFSLFLAAEPQRRVFVRRSRNKMRENRFLIST